VPRLLLIIIVEEFPRALCSNQTLSDQPDLVFRISQPRMVRSFTFGKPVQFSSQSEGQRCEFAQSVNLLTSPLHMYRRGTCHVDSSPTHSPATLLGVSLLSSSLQKLVLRDKRSTIPSCLKPLGLVKALLFWDPTSMTSLVWEDMDVATPSSHISMNLRSPAKFVLFGTQRPADVRPPNI
jgi:hypothetical protein